MGDEVVPVDALAGQVGAPALQEGGESNRGASQGLLTICLSVGRLVGASLTGGIAAGAAIAADGYRSAMLVIAVFGGRTYGAAIPAAWVVMWLLLAALEGRWLRAPRRSCRAAAAPTGDRSATPSENAPAPTAHTPAGRRRTPPTAPDPPSAAPS